MWVVKWFNNNDPSPHFAETATELEAKQVGVCLVNSQRTSHIDYWEDDPKDVEHDYYQQYKEALQGSSRFR